MKAGAQDNCPQATPVGQGWGLAHSCVASGGAPSLSDHLCLHLGKGAIPCWAACLVGFALLSAPRKGQPLLGTAACQALGYSSDTWPPRMRVLAARRGRLKQWLGFAVRASVDPVPVPVSSGA